MYHNFSSALLVQSSFKQLAEIIEEKKWTQIEGGVPDPASCYELKCHSVTESIWYMQPDEPSHSGYL